MILLVLVLVTAFPAFSNGANDNFKGVATVYGSSVAGYGAALTWTAATTFAGSIAFIYFAERLIGRFSGRGLVPDALTRTPEFLLSVVVGTGLTVPAASQCGFSISTTGRRTPGASRERARVRGGYPA